MPATRAATIDQLRPSPSRLSRRRAITIRELPFVRPLKLYDPNHESCFKNFLAVDRSRQSDGSPYLELSSLALASRLNSVDLRPSIFRLLSTSRLSTLVSFGPAASNLELSLVC